MTLIAYREVCTDLLRGLEELKHPRFPFPGYITAAMDRARWLLAQPTPAEPADHIRNGTEMVAPPAEGEVRELTAALRRVSPQNPMGVADPACTRAADVLEQQAAELATLRPRWLGMGQVGQRPWELEAGWLNSDGECWWCPSKGTPYLWMVKPAMMNGGWLLPANAIPLPPGKRPHA
jgi:hypothetical protein